MTGVSSDEHFLWCSPNLMSYSCVCLERTRSVQRFHSQIMPSITKALLNQIILAGPGCPESLSRTQPGPRREWSIPCVRVGKNMETSPGQSCMGTVKQAHGVFLLLTHWGVGTAYKYTRPDVKHAQHTLLSRRQAARRHQSASIEMRWKEDFYFSCLNLL